MSIQVVQRPEWYGTPRELGATFILKKSRREAKALVYSHQFGWELRLVIGTQLEVVQTQVCRSQDELLDTSARWKKALVEKGWD